MKPTRVPLGIVLLMGIEAIPATLGLTFIVISYADSSPGPMGNILALFGLFLLVPGAVLLLLTWGLWRRAWRRSTRK